VVRSAGTEISRSIQQIPGEAHEARGDHPDVGILRGGLVTLCSIRGMKIIDAPITVLELASMAEAGFGDLVKAVVDVQRVIMAVDGELHSDEEALLLENGSQQDHLWGINLYPALAPADFIEFDSLINIRPSRGNRSRGVDDPDLRERIVRIVDPLVLP
jgi:hypothetical protein